MTNRAHHMTPIALQQAETISGDNGSEDDLDVFWTSVASHDAQSKATKISEQLATAETGPQWSKIQGEVKEIVYSDPSDPNGPISEIETVVDLENDPSGVRDTMKT